MSVETAFKPFRCIAEVWDYQQKLRLKVFDENEQGIFEKQDIVLRHLRDENYLQDVVQTIREEIRAKGFVLI